MIADAFAGLAHLLLSGGLLVLFWLLSLVVVALLGYRWGRRDQAEWAVDQATADARWHAGLIAEVDAARTIPVQQRRGES